MEKLNYKLFVAGSLIINLKKKKRKEKISYGKRHTGNRCEARVDAINDCRQCNNKDGSGV
jgi:hypothetical protein